MSVAWRSVINSGDLHLPPGCSQLYCTSCRVLFRNGVVSFFGIPPSWKISVIHKHHCFTIQPLLRTIKTTPVSVQWSLWKLNLCSQQLITVLKGHHLLFYPNTAVYFGAFGERVSKVLWTSTSIGPLLHLFFHICQNSQRILKGRWRKHVAWKHP